MIRKIYSLFYGLIVIVCFLAVLIITTIFIVYFFYKAIFHK